GDGTPVERRRVRAAHGVEGRRDGDGGAAAVDRRRRGAGDAVAVEGGEERRHVRRPVVEVAVVVVGGQPLDVGVGGAAPAGASAAGAGVPGPDVAAALVEDLVAHQEGALAVKVEGRGGQIARHQVP